MDPITHLTQKLQAERARQPIHRQQPQQQPPPPPYEAADSDDEYGDDYGDPDSQPPSPLKLTINAANAIQGSNNLVPTSPTAIADATRFSAILLQTVSHINHLAQVGIAQSPRTMKIDLTINCGLTIVGDRNVVGNVGLKPKSPMMVAGPSRSVNQAVVGAKRKAEDVSHVSRALLTRFPVY